MKQNGINYANTRNRIPYAISDLPIKAMKKDRKMTNFNFKHSFKTEGCFKSG